MFLLGTRPPAFAALTIATLGALAIFDPAGFGKPAWIRVTMGTSFAGRLACAVMLGAALLLASETIVWLCLATLLVIINRIIQGRFYQLAAQGVAENRAEKA